MALRLIEYIPTPTENITITSNGAYNVKSKATATVNVPNGLIQEASAANLDSYLQTASTDSIYEYTGTSTSTYIQHRLYRIVENSDYYWINTTLSHCTGAASNPTQIALSGTATLTFTASSGYALPSSIIVTHADYTWNKHLGILVLSNPTGTITVTIDCVTAEQVTISGNWGGGQPISIEYPVGSGTYYTTTFTAWTNTSIRAVISFTPPVVEYQQLPNQLSYNSVNQLTQYEPISWEHELTGNMTVTTSRTDIGTTVACYSMDLSDAT